MLTPTDIWGEAVFLGAAADRKAGLESVALEMLPLGFDGVVGDAHGGATRAACTRVKRQYARGEEIRNARQLSIVSEEELAVIAAAMALPGPLRPEWVGANIVLRGVPDLTHLPPSARLIFEPAPGDAAGASIVVDIENGPCRHPGAVIERAHPGFGARFAAKARGRRGVVGWVERPGVIVRGARCRLHVPPQRLYTPLARLGRAAVA